MFWFHSVVMFMLKAAMQQLLSFLFLMAPMAPGLTSVWPDESPISVWSNYVRTDLLHNQLFDHLLSHLWRANQCISFYTQMLSFYIEINHYIYQCNVIAFPNLQFFFFSETPIMGRKKEGNPSCPCCASDVAFNGCFASNATWWWSKTEGQKNRRRR